MKYKEIISKPETELRKQLEELRGQAHDLAMKLRLNQAKNSHELGKIRKDIARILTFLAKQNK